MLALLLFRTGAHIVATRVDVACKQLVRCVDDRRARSPILALHGIEHAGHAELQIGAGRVVARVVHCQIQMLGAIFQGRELIEKTDILLQLRLVGGQDVGGVGAWGPSRNSRGDVGCSFREQRKCRNVAARIFRLFTQLVKEFDASVAPLAIALEKLVHASGSGFGGSLVVPAHS